MKQDSEGNSDTLSEAIGKIVRIFEQAWHAGHDHRIEDFWPRIPSFVDYEDIDPGHPATQKKILYELICVEMSLRSQFAQEPISRWEYHDRFPDDEDLVNQGYAWFLEQGMGRTFEQDDVLRTRQPLPDEIGMQTDFVIEPDGRLDEPRPERQIPEILGPYREIEFIGEGGFGVVYRAVDSRNGRPVALKFPRSDKLSDAEGMQLFRSEAQRAMSLKHEGIVATYAVEDIEGYFFIVQQLVDGTDLKKTIREPRTQKEIAALIADVADALAHANQHLVHRDLKPSNILIDRTGTPFIADFGLAMHESALLGAGKQICGTAPYMSPEQVRGKVQNLTGRSDIWSLGVILYEMLTFGKSRPFQGRNTEQIFDQIETKEPRPLRSIDPAIDRRLQEICFRCLEKTESRRYATADDVAIDLRSFADESTVTDFGEPARPQVAFVPRGLRSFDADDHDFFLELLPGPRDVNGLPGSLRFWKSRICEPVLSENRIPVGVLYGPSGSGKSSYVKAGLLPIVESRQNKSPVESVYVECTVGDTEVRLLAALRKRFNEIPVNASLPEVIAGLAAGKWQRVPRKMLIVLDQFEQRLSVGDNFAESQLVAALRQCDGQTVQCLLSVRDDFWMALSRFCDALAIDLREGLNAQAIDLFDKRHAARILAKFGHAYERLPSSELDELSEDQRDFVTAAVDQLAQNNLVICVRLILFAEMFRHQPWSVPNLQQAGNVAGVGVQFLDRELGPQNRKVPHHAAFRLLCSLLPAAGTDIRGAMKSELELAGAADLATDSAVFKNTIALLDGELRLITRCDPDVSGPVEGSGPKTNDRARHFQLTHDYLVPTIRAWQDKWLGDTRRGRAQLRLQRLASEVMAGKPPDNLPTHLEWLSWQVLLRGHRFTGNQPVVMRAARRRFFKDTSIAATIIIVVGGLIGWMLVDLSRDQEAERLVKNLMTDNWPAIPGVVRQLPALESRVLPNIGAALKRATEEERRRLQLGLLQFDPSHLPEIVQNVVRPDCRPAEFSSSLDVLRAESSEIGNRFRELLMDESRNQASQFRSAVALINLGYGDDVQWDEHAGMLGTVLGNVPGADLESWITLTRPAADGLREAFVEMLKLASSHQSAYPLALCIQEYDDGRSLADLAEIIVSSQGALFDPILDAVERRQDLESIANELVLMSTDALDDRGVALRGLALLRAGQPDAFLRCLASTTERPGIRSYAMILAVPPHVDFCLLQKLWSARDKFQPAVRQGVLLAIARQIPQMFDEGQRGWVKRAAMDLLENEKNAGCFAAAELILRILKIDPVPLRESRVGWNNEIYINNELLAFSVISIPSDDGIQHLAVAMTELTEQELSKCPEFSETYANPTSRPVMVAELSDIHVYCQWLDERDKVCKVGHSEIIPGSIAEEDGPKSLNLKIGGYRLMTVEEWLAISGATTSGTEFLGTDHELARFFAWTAPESEGQTQKVGTLLPMPNGLFDLLGNCCELCTYAKPGLGVPAITTKILDLASIDRELETVISTASPPVRAAYLEVGNFSMQSRRVLSFGSGRTIALDLGFGGVQRGIRLVRTLDPEATPNPGN